MNLFIGCGRLTKDVELRYSSKDSSMAIARYTLAIDTGYGEKKRTDFISCVAFGKAGEFANKYFTKGQRVLVEGRLQIDKSEKDGKYYTNIIISNQEFADGNTKPQTNVAEGFTDIPNNEDDLVPFS